LVVVAVVREAETTVLVVAQLAVVLGVFRKDWLP
jgi:hypothetical protein